MSKRTRRQPVRKTAAPQVGIGGISSSVRRVDGKSVASCPFIDRVAILRRALAWITVIASAAGAPAEEAAPLPSDRAPRHADIQVWLPIRASVDGSNGGVESGPRSSATYRLESSCPPGTWRWATGGQAQQVEFDIASALIIRIEGPETTRVPGEDDPLARAGEEVADTFRVQTGLDSDETGDVAFRFSSTPDTVGQLLEIWEQDLEQNIDVAAQAIERALAGLDSPRTRITAIIAREHVIADCAPIEICSEGRWLAGGHRATSARRIPLAPVFHESARVEATDNGSNLQAAWSAVKLVGQWLHANYAREAAAAAILADGGDPCSFAAGSGIQTASR